MKDKLNTRQQLFCQYLLQGKSHTDAAITAGYAPKSAGYNADKLLKNTKIKQYLASLQMSIAEGNIANASERKTILTEIAREKRIRPATPKETVLAIAELNKMEGDYAPEKHATLGNIIVEVVYRDKTEYNGIKEGQTNAVQIKGGSAQLLEGEKEGTKDVQPDLVQP